MPVYEYKCQACNRRARIFISYAEYDAADPACPHCGERRLQRRIGRIAFARSEESRLDSLMTDQSLAGLEDDPRAMGKFMRQMTHEMGEDLGSEYEEVVERLEKGEPPESIEKSMPELGDDGPGDDF